MTCSRQALAPHVSSVAARSRPAPPLVMVDNCAHVCVRRDVDLTTSLTITQIAVMAIREARTHEIALDLGLVSASAIGALVAVCNPCIGEGTRLVLSNVPNQVTRLLTLTDLQNHFTVMPNADHERASCRPSRTNHSLATTQQYQPRLGQTRHRIERPRMAPSTNKDVNHTPTPSADPKADHEAAVTPRDPRNTDHPTGEKQAAENTENEAAG